MTVVVSHNRCLCGACAAADEALAAVTRERDEACDELATVRANAERLTSYVGMSAEVETLRGALYSVTKNRDALLVRIAELEAGK